MFSFLIFIFILSIMILVHEFGHFITARKLGIRVEKFSLGFGQKLLSYRKSSTEYSLCLIPFGGYVKLAGDSWQECKGGKHEFLGRKISDRFKVIFAGPALNYALAYLCFWMVNVVGYPNLTAKIGEVMQGYPAQEAGLLEDDTVISVDGNPVKYWQELQDIIRSKKAGQLDLEVLRNGDNILLSVGLRREGVKNIFGQEQKVNIIGIRPKGETVVAKHNIAEGFILAGKNLWNLTTLTLGAIGRMFTGTVSLKESVTGPLGMFYITSEAVRLGLSAVLHLMAVLSASLAIFNLLPLPVLDGGHIFFLGLEKIRGRHLSQKAEENITKIGFGLIMALAVFVFLNDLERFGALEWIMKIIKK
ncbi:RIP metalloprotease RseP [bacterium]|nr:MAG: RIP metalloprotease RseP [bacterium]